MIERPNRILAFILLLVVIALATVPLLADTYFLKFFTRVLVLAIFAMSLDLLIGYTGLVSFGHAAFFGLAAYCVYFFSPEYEAANILIALPASLAITAVAALAIGALVVRTKGIYFIMVTLAFAQTLFYFFHDSAVAGGSDGALIFVKPALTLGGVTLLDFENREVFYYVCLASVVAVYFLLAAILRSPFGQVIQGIKLNEQRMRALGYNTYHYKLVSFVIAGVLAGLAGFLFAAIDGFVAPELLGWSESGSAIIMVVLGGMGTLFGPALGALAYAGMEEVFREPAIFGGLAEHWQILMGCFVIAVVLLLRHGIAGLLRSATERRAREPSQPRRSPQRGLPDDA